MTGERRRLPAYIHPMPRWNAVLLMVSCASMVPGQQLTEERAAPSCDSLRALARAEKLTDTVLVDVSVAILQGRCLVDLDSALLLARRAVALADRSKDRRRWVAAQRAKCQVHTLREERDSAIAALESCVPWLSSLHDAELAETVHMNLATRYDRKIDLVNCVRHFEQVLRSRELRGDAHGVAEVLNDIGIIRVQQGDVDGALRYHERSLGIFEQLGDSGRVAATLNRIGVARREQGDPVAALKAHERSLMLYRALGRDMGSSAALNNLAATCNLLGDYERAAAYAREGLAIREQGGETVATAYSLIQLGWARLHLGHPAEAVQLGERSRRISLKTNIVTVERDVSEMLYAAYKGMGRTDRALEMHERFVMLRDSFLAEENQRAVLRQEYEHEAYRTVLADSLAHAEAVSRLGQERQVERSAAAAQRRQIITVALAILVLGLGTAFYFFDRRRRTARFEREQAVLQERLRIADDLHDDLGAGLSALKLRSALAMERANGDGTKDQLGAIASTADGLMENMRQILWAMGTEHAQLDDLVKYITVYARQYLETHDLGFRAMIAEGLPTMEVNALQRRNIFLIVKEALHNVVKHAAARHVVITVGWSDGLMLSIVDDGRGMQPVSAGRGNGMRTMHKRAAILGGVVEVAPAAGSGTRVSLSMTFKEGLNKRPIGHDGGRSDLRAHA